MRKPDFERNLLRVLAKEAPARATLFELFMNRDFYERLAGHAAQGADTDSQLALVIDAFAAAGYDYATTHASAFAFAKHDRARAQTVSLNEGAVIADWADFEAYAWADPDDYDTGHLVRARERLPEGMKLMVMGPGGVLENLIGLTGYDNLCIMLFEEPALVRAIVDRIGEALVKYYEGIAGMDTVGFLCSNDDWGFNTQTFLSPADMRTYIFPWHRRIVEVAHRHGKPCILHSCGYFDEVIDDVIDDMRFDARHSYEDAICPVEVAYDRLYPRIAVLGGMDMDFMVRRTPEEIFARATAMLDKARAGGYALGTGNSVPEYVPFDNYMALVRAALAFDGA